MKAMLTRLNVNLFFYTFNGVKESLTALADNKKREQRIEIRDN